MDLRGYEQFAVQFVCCACSPVHKQFSIFWSVFIPKCSDPAQLLFSAAHVSPFAHANNSSHYLHNCYFKMWPVVCLAFYALCFRLNVFCYFALAGALPEKTTAICTSQTFLNLLHCATHKLLNAVPFHFVFCAPRSGGKPVQKFLLRSQTVVCLAIHLRVAIACCKNSINVYTVNVNYQLGKKRGLQCQFWGLFAALRSAYLGLFLHIDRAVGALFWVLKRPAGSLGAGRRDQNRPKTGRTRCAVWVYCLQC